MSPTFIFLFGLDMAYQMRLLEQGLRATERQHQAYFAHLPAHHLPLYAAPRLLSGNRGENFSTLKKRKIALSL